MDNPAAPLTPIVEPVVAPVVTPVQPAITAPTEPVQAAPVVEATPAVAPAPAPVEAVTAPVVAPIEAPKEPVTLLAAEPKVEAVTPPVETVGEKNEGGQSDEPAPPPKYENWALPEGVTLGETELGEFTNILSALELEGKADHSVTQQTGQKLVDFHINELRKAVQSVHQANLDSWEATKTEWKESFLKDPEIGGNRFQTTVDAAQTFIRTHGGTPDQQTEFRQLMETSGLGNHPAMIRILASAQLAMNEGGIVAATVPPAAPKSKVATFYGKG